MHQVIDVANHVQSKIVSDTTLCFAAPLRRPADFAAVLLSSEYHTAHRRARQAAVVCLDPVECNCVGGLH